MFDVSLIITRFWSASRRVGISALESGDPDPSRTALQIFFPVFWLSINSLWCARTRCSHDKWIRFQFAPVENARALNVVKGFIIARRRAVAVAAASCSISNKDNVIAGAT